MREPGGVEPLGNLSCDRRFSNPYGPGHQQQRNPLFSHVLQLTVNVAPPRAAMQANPYLSL